MAGQGRLLSRQSTYKLCPTSCYLLFCYLFRKYQESQWPWFYFQEPTRIPWEGFSLTPSFSSSGMKPESWGCLDSFINYIQRQLHLWLAPILMYPVRGQRMLRWGTVYKPSSLLAHISNLGSSQNHRPFWLFSRRIRGAHRALAYSQSQFLWGKARISWGKRCRRLIAGGFREWAFQLSSPGSEGG